ncbi:Anti-silencing protein, ASF1-like protein [Ancylostoma duodenale]|uniref:Anti-silencing protein, ASF1-like protein n=1 Tax=Ancylostoma duodenale TaxID=51022 RepID=A0A0C2CAD6_9BILA|nr:Anti-silencing protein, ASF1-like protein [Ancylostoma duodenale]
MASRVNVCSVNILDNPSTFTAQFKLEITFEVFEYLPNDLEWELVYVGSAKSSSYDQVLDSALVGPVPEGRHKFVFAVDAPDPAKIPVQDLVGVTVLLLRCKYNGQEFINLGWFVSNDYEDPELKENPPAKPIIEKLTRTVQTDDLRVTSFPIKWDENQPDEYPPEQEQVEVDETDLMPLEDIVDEEEKQEEEEVGHDVEMAEDTAETSGNTSATENVTENGSAPKDDKAEVKEAGDAPFSDVTNDSQVAQPEYGIYGSNQYPDMSRLSLPGAVCLAFP